MSVANLTIVPTPIGNLEDITYRAVRLLKEVDYIMAEDTRTSSKLMKAYEISTPLKAFHLHNEHVLAEKVADDIVSGARVALISDAGTPGISDPGFLLVRSCLEKGVEVTSLPGPTACITALVASGLPCERYRYEGFLPPKKGRITRLACLKDSEVTTVYYESPLRLVKFLEEIATIVEPTRQVVVARELTKKHEQYLRGTITELLHYFQETSPLGEMVVLISPCEKTPREHTNKYKKHTNI